MLAANYELPFGKGMKWGSDWGGLTDAILGGWKVSAIYQARSGFPLTVRDIGGRTLQAVRGNERPNCIGNPVPSNQGMTSDPNAPNDSKWIDIDAFESAPLGTWGNCGIGITDAPGFTQHRPHAGQALQRGRGSVISSSGPRRSTRSTTRTGRPPGVSLASPNTFGIITGTVNAPRVIQLALKFYF